MPKTRVLVVDDSVVVRRIVSDVIAAEPTCEVVGSAANGKIALARIEQVNPDIVTLDIEMPEMDGLETLAAIRKKHPTLPVIMFSALTERAASATLKALALGATDYVTKPSASNILGAAQQIRSDLIPKIVGLRKGASPVTARDIATPPRVAPTRRGPAIDIVAIGCSTGGPNALATILPALSATFPVPIVITQHMPPLFTRLLSERLNANSALTVREAAGGEALDPGHVYLAPGDFHMGVRRDGTTYRTTLNQGPHENSCRPAVDVMMRSVVEVFGGRTLAVVLTGMGQDGLRGCELVREAGGQVVVQDEATSVVWGMPGYIARAGLAHTVVPIAEVAAEIERRVKSSRAPREPSIIAGA